MSKARRLGDDAAHLLAVWFGCGHVPFAPGTAGTLGAVPLYLLVRPLGVAAIPPSAFYADPRQAPMLARFCFAKRAETIEAAAERLRKLRRIH